MAEMTKNSSNIFCRLWATLEHPLTVSYYCYTYVAINIATQNTLQLKHMVFVAPVLSSCSLTSSVANKTVI